jgi:hypothetical protein
VALFRGRAQATDRPLPAYAVSPENDTDQIENAEKT